MSTLLTQMRRKDGGDGDRRMRLANKRSITRLASTLRGNYLSEPCIDVNSTPSKRKARADKRRQGVKLASDAPADCAGGDLQDN